MALSKGAVGRVIKRDTRRISRLSEELFFRALVNAEEVAFEVALCWPGNYPIQNLYEIFSPSIHILGDVKEKLGITKVFNGLDLASRRFSKNFGIFMVGVGWKCARR